MARKRHPAISSAAWAAGFDAAIVGALAPMCAAIAAVVAADIELADKIDLIPGVADTAMPVMGEFWASFWTSGLWLDYAAPLLMVAAGLWLVLFLAFHIPTMGQSREVSDGAYGDATVWEGRDAAKRCDVWRGPGRGPTEPSLVIGASARRFLVEVRITHALILGQSGCGKGQLILKETAMYNMANGHNMLVTGKSDNWEELSDKARDLGYEVVAFLDVNGYPGASSYNPLSPIVAAYERGDETWVTRIDMLGTVLVPEVEGNGKVFNDGARDLLVGSVTYVVMAEDCPADQKTLATCIELVQRLTAGEDQRNPWAPLQALARSLPEGHPAKASWRNAVADGKTTMAKNTLATFNTHLRPFLQPTMRRVMDHSDLDAREMLERKSFVCVNLMRDDHPYHKLYQVFFSQLSFEADRLAEERGGELPRQLVVLGDEITAIGRLDCLPEWLKVGRSRGIHLYLFAQGLAAFNKYNQRGDGGAGAASIIDNCGLKVALTVANPDDAAKLARICGTKSVMTVNSGESRGGGSSHASSGRSEAKVDVVPAAEFVRNSPMHGSGAIVHKDGGEAGEDRAGTYRLPLRPAAKTLAGPFFDFGDKAHDARKRAEFRHRAEEGAAAPGPLSETWCPDVSDLMGPDDSTTPLEDAAREVRAEREQWGYEGMDEF